MLHGIYLESKVNAYEKLMTFDLDDNTVVNALIARAHPGPTTRTLFNKDFVAVANRDEYVLFVYSNDSTYQLWRVRKLYINVPVKANCFEHLPSF
jgi:hypothetical protein